MEVAGAGSSDRSASCSAASQWGAAAGEVYSGGLGEVGDGRVADEVAAVVDPGASVAGGLADDGGGEAPAVEDAADAALAAPLDDDEHPLLGLGEHDLVGGHARLAPGHLGDVDLQAEPALGGGLDGGAGEAGRAEILHGEHLRQSGGLEAGLDEALFEEGIAHLHGGAQLLRLLEGAGGKPGRTVDAVAARLRADEDDGVAGTPGGRGDKIVVAEESDAHRVDEGIFAVGVVEEDLAPDVGDAEAVAVAADAGDDPLQKMAVLRLVGGPEAERVQESDGSRAHREDVADDAADARCRSLVGLDGRGVVVRLDLHGHGQAAADVDDAGVLLALLDHDTGPGVGEAAEQRLGVLVAAVFAPQGAEHAELEGVGLAVEPVDDHLVLGGAEGHLVEHLLGYRHGPPPEAPPDAARIRLGSGARRMTSRASSYHNDGAALLLSKYDTL